MRRRIKLGISAPASEDLRPQLCHECAMSLAESMRWRWALSSGRTLTTSPMMMMEGGLTSFCVATYGHAEGQCRCCSDKGPAHTC